MSLCPLQTAPTGSCCQLESENSTPTAQERMWTSPSSRCEAAENPRKEGKLWRTAVVVGPEEIQKQPLHLTYHWPHPPKERREQEVPFQRVA